MAGYSIAMTAADQHCNDFCVHSVSIGHAELSADDKLARMPMNTVFVNELSKLHGLYLEHPNLLSLLPGQSL